MHNWKLTEVRGCAGAKELFARLGINDVQDYENFVVDDKFIVCFIWDTRKVTKVVDLIALQNAGNTEAYNIVLQLAKLPIAQDAKLPLVVEDVQLPEQCKVLTLDVSKCPAQLICNNDGNRFEDHTYSVKVGATTIGGIRKVGNDYCIWLKLQNEDYSSRNVDVTNKFSNAYAAFDKLCSSWDYITSNYKVYGI